MPFYICNFFAVAPSSIELERVRALSETSRVRANGLPFALVSAMLNELEGLLKNNSEGNQIHLRWLPDPALCPFFEEGRWKPEDLNEIPKEVFKFFDS